MKNLTRFTRQVILLALIATITLFTPVGALSKAERSFYGKNNIFFYNPDGDCIRGEGEGYAGTVSGNDNESKIWNYFVSAGINGISNNPAAIAGIMGNLYTESGYNPFALSGSGTYHGLYQSNSPSMIQEVNSRLGNHWGLSNTPVEINDEAIKIELDYLVNDKFASPEKRFQAYANSALTNNISNSANGAEIYAELFMVAVERAYGGSEKLQSSEAKTLAHNLGLQRYANGGWQGLNARRNKAAEIYNRYATGSAPSSTLTVNTNLATNNISYNTCRTGNNSPYTGIGIPQYFQCGESWSNLMYGDSGIHGSEGATICASGCGPTSFAMMATVLLGKNILPDEVADIAGKAGMHYYGQGSSWAITRVLAQHYGLQYKALNTCDISTINQYLQDGWMIHTSGTGRAPFTQSGHYIGITSVNSNGEWYIANSAGRNNANGYYSPTAVVSAGMKCSNVKAIKR